MNCACWHYLGIAEDLPEVRHLKKKSPPNLVVQTDQLHQSYFKSTPEDQLTSMERKTVQFLRHKFTDADKQPLPLF